ncbi:glycoside hydrolase family protein [Salipaludibacillus keqinensis]|nr:beta-L-arabinofuranosidase domain-containing protein [Salipaludibacillus keqinensis]
MEEIFQVVLKKKDSLANTNTKYTNAYKTKDGDVVVFLSFSNKYMRAYVATGKGKDVQSAIEEAISVYRKNKAVNFKPVSVKLDVVTMLLPVKKDQSRININKDEVFYRRGEDGLALSEDFSAAFLPEEVEAYRMIKNRHIQKDRVFDAFEKHFLLPEQKITKNFIGNDFMDLFKFRTDSHYIDKDGYLPLHRGHRTYEDLSKEDLWKAIELTKDNYYKQVVNSKGKYIYSYMPQEVTQADDYNILRHAGTTYSMLETYELMPDENLMKAIERAIKYLLTKVKDIEINGHKAQVVVEKNKCKLGGNGLSIVTLAKYTQLTGNKEYVPLMQDMATWMGQLQDETGKFAVHKQVFSTGEDSGFVSHYYPGEAILSLVRLYQVDKNEKWLDLAENEANYLINIRDKEADLDSIAHDHWLLYALNDLYRERPKDMYMKHAFFISEAIVKAQRLDKKEYNSEWIGSFEQPGTPRSTPAACRSEGLCAAYRMAMDHGHKKEADQYKKTIIETIKFQLQMQLKPESVMYYTNKKLCLGAFHAGLKNYELRNDYTQHNISSLIAFYNILNNY